MADRFWVGGSGTWDASTTTNWSATSGGGGGASAPTSADNVFFDGASASGNYTVNTSGLPVCANISIAKATAGTLGVAGVSVGVYGSWTSVATGVTWALNTTFLSTSGTQTITTNGLSPSSGAGFVFNGAGGTWQLQDNLTLTGTLALTAGTLDINGLAVSCNFVNVSSNAVRVLAFGTGGTITCPNTTGGYVWNGQDATNFSYSGTGSVNFTYSGSFGTRIIQHGAVAGGGMATKAPPFNISAGSDTIAFSTGISHFGDLNFTGFTGTVSNTTKYMYGNLTVGSGTNFAAGANQIAYVATSGTYTITTNGRTMDVPLTFGALGQTIRLGDNYTGGNTTTSIFTLTAGNLDLNGKTFSTFGVNAGGSSARAIIPNGGIINVFGGNATVWTSATLTGATFSNVNVNFTYSGNVGNRGIAPGSATEANSININITSGTDNIILNGSSRDVNFTGFSGNLNATTRVVYGNLTYSPTMNVVASSGVTTSFGATSGTKIIDTKGIDVINSFTVSGLGGTYQLANNFNMWNGSAGTLFTVSAGTLDLNDKTLTAGFFNSAGAAVRNINFGNSGVINLALSASVVWNASSANNFSYSGNGIVNFTANASSGNRTIAHGSSAGTFPTNLPPKFNITAGTDNVITTLNSNLNSLDFTGFSGNLTNTGRYIHSNLTLSPTMTLIAGPNITAFSGNGVQYFDSANILIDCPIAVGNGNSTGTMVLANTTTLGNTRILNVASGTFNANGYNLTAGYFASTNANSRQVNISNTTVTLNAAGGTMWNFFIPTNLTLNAANSNIVITNPSGNPGLYLGNGVTYDNVVFAGAGLSTIYPSGNVTVNTLTSTSTGNRTFVFNGDANNYTTINNWNIVGDAGNTVSLTSDNGTPFNIVYGGNSTVNVSYHTISYSSASPADKWYALTTNNNANGGNNTGWIFTYVPPATSSNFFLVF